jgi:hypothetical protein
VIMGKMHINVAVRSPGGRSSQPKALMRILGQTLLHYSNDINEC